MLHIRTQHHHTCPCYVKVVSYMRQIHEWENILCAKLELRNCSTEIARNFSQEWNLCEFNEDLNTVNNNFLFLCTILLEAEVAPPLAAQTQHRIQ